MTDDDGSVVLSEGGTFIRHLLVVDPLVDGINSIIRSIAVNRPQTPRKRTNTPQDDKDDDLV